MRIAIFGSGGVGGYFGGRLAQAGNDVTFIARGEHLAAIRQNGLRVNSIVGDFVLDKVQATDSPKTVGKVDIVICAVKAWQVTAAAKSMKPMIGHDTLVIPLQNGIEATGQLAALLGADAILGGLCALIAFQASPGHIKHIGANPLIRFNRLDGQADSRVNLLSEVFNHCNGVKSSIPSDINVAMWLKFMLISPWSGIGAVSQAPIGILLKLPETRQLLLDSMREIYQLGLAQGINLAGDCIQKTITVLESLPESSTTSLQQDMAKGKPSELDEQSGAVVRLSKALGIDTPVNRFILDSLRPQELRARGALTF
ncbi:MAG: 2-dehydropantoate 2-reductase [Gammaproteobacteria bacterium]|jgi:2-dehydropantoate 2-reductase